MTSTSFVKKRIQAILDLKRERHFVPGFILGSYGIVMMATLLAYSRLSANSELKALRSLGVRTQRMIAPALILAILMVS